MSDQTLAVFDPAADFAAALVAALPLERLKGVDPEELRKVLAGVVAPVNDALKPMSLRAEAIQLHRKAAELLDEADRLEFVAKLVKVAAEADGVLTVAVSEADRLAESMRVAVETERAAADRLAEAREVARLARDQVEDLALTQAAADQQVEAVVRQGAADQIAGRFNLAAEKATAERIQAEAALATAREAVRQTRIVVKAAKDAADNPPDAPVSAWTASLDGLRRMASGEPMDKGSEDVVAVLVESLMRTLDLDRIYMNRGRKAEQEAQLKRATPPLPKVAAQRREGSAIVLPPGVASIAPRFP